MDEGNINVEQQSKLPSEAEIGSSVEEQETDPSPESNEPTSTVPDTDENVVSSTSNEDQIDGEKVESDDQSLDEKSAVSSPGLNAQIYFVLKHIIYLLLQMLNFPYRCLSDLGKLSVERNIFLQPKYSKFHHCLSIRLSVFCGVKFQANYMLHCTNICTFFIGVVCKIKNCWKFIYKAITSGSFKSVFIEKNRSSLYIIKSIFVGLCNVECGQELAC